MNAIAANIKGILLVTGALTTTMIYAAIAPEAALRSTFGEALHGPLATLIVRNWGVLITLVGALLIYAAFNPPVRRAAVAVAGSSKLAFIALVLAAGAPYLQGRALVAVIADSVMVVAFAACLAAQDFRFTHET